MARKKLKPQSIKILKMIHIIFAFGWLIGGITLCLLVFIITPTSGDELFMHSRILQIIDYYFIIPGALGALITGLVYSIWTNWGFFKHRWITVKWVMIIIQIISGTFILGPCIDENVVIANQFRDAALFDVVFLNNLQITKTLGTIQTVMILFLVIISVQKPWKKIKN